MSEIQITASQLKAKADELSNQNQQFKAQIELLDETEQRLNAMWEGEANTAFHTAFSNDKIQLNNFYNAIQQYVQVMQNIAARYAQVEAQNTEIANARKY